MSKQSSSSLLETLPDSGIQTTTSGLIVLSEGWHSRPNTLPVTRQIFSNDSTITNVTTRNGLPTIISIAISICFVRLSFTSSTSTKPNCCDNLSLIVVINLLNGLSLFKFTACVFSCHMRAGLSCSGYLTKSPRPSRRRVKFPRRN